jgi:hypothetical protein
MTPVWRSAKTLVVPPGVAENLRGDPGASECEFGVGERGESEEESEGFMAGVEGKSFEEWDLCMETDGRLGVK